MHLEKITHYRANLHSEEIEDLQDEIWLALQVALAYWGETLPGQDQPFPNLDKLGAFIAGLLQREPDGQYNQLLPHRCNTCGSVPFSPPGAGGHDDPLVNPPVNGEVGPHPSPTYEHL
jgi:hypothetical protein